MVKILNVDVYDKSLNSLIISIIESISDYNIQFKPALISATSSHGLVVAQKDRNFFEVLNEFSCILPDGMPLVWLGKFKRAKNMERCYGPKFFREVIIATRDKCINHYLCGGKDGVADELKQVCLEKFGNKNIVGTFTPPFREMSEEEIQKLAKEINQLNVNIVWVGLSTPKQEMLAYRLSKYARVNFICTVGAAFDFHTGRVKQAPKWIQNIGLEWLFRLLMEPKRLWKRYFTVVPLFIWYNFLDYVKKRINK